jgi:hypothetical protein
MHLPAMSVLILKHFPLIVDWNILDQVAVAALETANDELAQVMNNQSSLIVRAVWTDYLHNFLHRRGHMLF